VRWPERESLPIPSASPFGVMPEPRSATSIRPTTTTLGEEKPAGGGLSMTQVFGGALAAVTSAVAASSLGVAGTLIGAAVASVISTIAATLYSSSLKRAARASRTLVVRQTLAPVRPQTEPELADRPGEPEPAPHPVQESVWQRIRWKPVLIAAGGVFLAAMAVIFVSELALGHPISNSRESGTTISNLGGGGSAPQPSGTTTPASTPTSSPSESPSESPTPTSSVSPTGGSPSPSATVPSTLATTVPGTTAPTTTASSGGSTNTSSAPAAPSPGQ
jgi:hypothetical protein